jgi:uncharacterized protein YbjT (DUF2867 family)
MTSILIAGATGWLGQQIANEVLNAGAKVRLMVRGGAANKKVADLAALTARGATLVDADIAVPASLDAAVAGVDVIVSALQGGPDVIVDGQAALATAGKRAGVQRLFTSDYAVDFRTIPDAEHLFFSWRKAGQRAIAATGLTQVNTYNGAFMDMLLQPFFGLLDVEKSVVAHWGDADQPYDFTTTADTARFVAAAVLDPKLPAGPFQIAGDTLSPRQLAVAASTALGKPFRVDCLGSLEDLASEIARRQAAEPNNPRRSTFVPLGHWGGCARCLEREKFKVGAVGASHGLDHQLGIGMGIDVLGHPL